MKNFKNLHLLLLASLFVALGHFSGGARGSTLVDFSDLSLPPSSYWSGPDPNGTPATGPYGDAEIVGQFSSGGLDFVNRYSQTWDSWEGFAYSNVVDTTTPGYGNQYAAVTGGGIRGPGSTYAVAYEGSFSPTILFPAPTLVLSADITNTTYAYLSMLNGDSYANYSDKFTSSDYLELMITGLDKNGNPTAPSVPFYLATGTDILDCWKNVNLSSLGAVSSLQFDVIQSNPYTPSYFAVGDLTVAPEPSSLALLGGGVLTALVAWRRRRSK
jgi:hypothetical protein